MQPWFKKIYQPIKKWINDFHWKKDWPETIFIVLMLASVFTRLYNLPNTISFQGDQGRDAMIVARIFRKNDPVFIGPVTSVGNMYLGPLYYYFMLPFLMITFPSPLGPHYAVAILGILTVYLMYYLGQKMFGKRTALIATFFYTFSYVVMIYTRFSWNPNPAPLVSLLLIYYIYQAFKKPKFWLGVFICISVLLQLHYITLLAAATAALIWLANLIIQLRSSKLSDKKNKDLFKYTILGFLIFLASLLPLMLFDAKHNWLNAKAFQKLLTKEENFAHSTTELSLPQKILATLMETEGRAMHILFEYNIGKNRALNRFLLIIFMAILIKISLNKKDKHHQAKLILLTFFLIGIFGLATYQHTVFDHYIAYLFPVSAFILGLVFDFLLNKKIIGSILLISFGLFFLKYNHVRKIHPLKSLGWTIKDIERTSNTILERVKDGEKYNIVLFSESKDSEGQNYRYFLSISDKAPVDTEHRGEIDTLFVIDEMQTQKLSDSPIYEIVTFPNKEPTEVYKVQNGPIVNVLSREI